MRRFFIETKKITGSSVIITGKEAHHIKDVIRLNQGDRFLGFDGTGKTYTLRIKRLAGSIEAQIEKISSETPALPTMLLAVALPKKSKFDNIVEKATELGVSEIIPMVTEHTIIKIDEKVNSARQRRWENIALEASKQCGRTILPKVYAPVDFKKAITITEERGYKDRIIPCLYEGARYIDEALSKNADKAAIFIGPEGDFTSNEIEYARSQNIIPVSLGPLVLKVDTACIFSISVIQNKAHI